MARFIFDHETLDAYRLSVQCAKTLRRAKWPRGFSNLRDQGLRAVESVVLNLAEGRNFDDGNRLKHYASARASAAEVCAVLDLVDLEGAAELQENLRRVGLMLTRLR